MINVTSPVGSRHSLRGFTLVETIVVLAIVTMLLALLPPLFSGPLDKLQLRRTVYQVASDLRLAQQAAIIQSRETEVQINVDQLSYRNHRQADAISMDAVKKIKLLSDARLRPDDQSGSIVFYPDGSSSGGHIVLTGSQQSYHIKITWISGHVQIDNQET